jgi:phosphorylase/glycogen(starch) synthase
MSKKSILKADYVFEASWEICNKVGGIYTVISTKVPLMVKRLGDNYITLGPDVWKETAEHPDFTEDANLYKAWREKALAEGLNIRVGRWNVPGSPVAILVDFTPFFTTKNDIFTHLWKTYQLDSLSGQWDYIEPALFGYAAARVIESFYTFYLTAQDKMVAQFHEWMTGVGVLYLKENVPQAATVFTTHATTLGRTLCGNNVRLYSEMDKIDPYAQARYFNVAAKYSLEYTAAQEADSFTTVSDITAIECKHFLKRDVDVVTQNGFDDSFVPGKDIYLEKQQEARGLLFRVAQALIGGEIDPKSLLVLHSGRYEYRSKGIDLFIDSLAELNRTKGVPVLAFIMIPANQAGPKKNLVTRMKDPGYKAPDNPYLTHYLHDDQNDIILNRFKETGLLNRPEDTVKVIFVPAYLDGRDGIFNKHYYDLLSGFNLTIFPSYYEPWGYTPLESAAFSIPTLTTSLAGFGLWVKSLKKRNESAVHVIERDDDNATAATEAIVSFVKEYFKRTDKEREELNRHAFEISRSALWESLIDNYFKAYDQALKIASGRFELYGDKQPHEMYFLTDIPASKKPVWNKVMVEPNLPAGLEKLRDLSRNLWWSWNFEAQELFESIDPEAWKRSGKNPLAMVEVLSNEQFKALEKDKSFLTRLDQVHGAFMAYMKEAENKPADLVAYFSMEYGLNENLKIYSGGLGVLAGDYLKEASDSNKNIIGVGLFYRYGYFQQNLSLFGDQISLNQPQKNAHLPITPVTNDNGDPVRISLALPGRNIYAHAWRVDIGRIPLYLLDADIPENLPNDRQVTHQLYGGDWENRFKQELLLGVGGKRLLSELGIHADVYHCNEGHAAFLNMERLRILVQNWGLTFNQAKEVVRSSSLFTTHTPVPAGHDAFDEDMLRTYIPHYAERLNISWQEFMNLGKFTENDPGEKFSMSVLAFKLSQEVNGVSRIHGRVTREMFKGLYEGFFADELHIGHVTNGVHHPTWTGKKWLNLYRQEFGPDYLKDQSDPMPWEHIRQVPDKTIWELRNHYRRELVSFMRERMLEEMTKRQENPSLRLKIIDSLDENALTIGFARRFATYKRAHLLFTNLERLTTILNNEQYPVQIVFAGKAHPADKAGQDLIKHIVELSKSPKLIGKVFFIENYDMEVGRKLVQGVDIWLNTPTRPLEASGTSGEKALMNGVLNLSVLDGWWAEGYQPRAGWGLQEARTYANQQFQDELDAEMIYDIIEEEALPMFYARTKGVPETWISYIKNSIAGIAPHYTMKRMLDDYQNKYYNKLIKRSKQIKESRYKMARELEDWKDHVREAWNRIEVKRIAVPDQAKRPLLLGDDFIAEIDLILNGLSPDEIGLDIIFAQKEGETISRVIFCEEMKSIEYRNNGSTRFTCRLPMERVGTYDYAFRLYPKSSLLPHKQDFNLVKWL